MASRILIILFLVLSLASCDKADFTSAPQIRFISISPESRFSDDLSITGPLLTFRLTDLEGDFGFQDTSISYVYVRNAADTLNSPDSLAFPDLPIADKRKLDVDVSVDILDVLPPPRSPRPYTDTLYFEVYVKDFAGQKSNVIRSTRPFYYVTP